MSSDEDVPPLEDCSDLLERASGLREAQRQPAPAPAAASASAPDSDSDTAPAPAPAAAAAAAASAPASDSIADPSDAPDDPDASPAADAGPPKSFGGMRRGFLFGGRPPARPQGDGIPVIAPSQSRADELQIDEVQESMKAQLGFKEGWMSDELITKMVQNPKMLSWLSDPRTNRVLEEFQKDPAAAKEKYKDNADILQFFRDFGKLLGDHFTSLADREEAEKKRRELDDERRRQEAEAQIRPEVEAQVHRALEDPEVRAALMDEDVQRAIQAIRNDPANGDRILHTANSRLRYHLTTLVKAGIIGVQ